MNDKAKENIHWSFWLISILMLIWNIMGAINFVVQMMDAEMVASMSETHRAIIEARPLWATTGFALAVFAGALGCIFLLLKKSFAFYLFIASLLGVIITMIHTLSIGISFTSPDLVMMVMMPLIVAAFLAWYSKLAIKTFWIH